MTNSETSQPTVIRGRSARAAAQVFNWGNIIAILLPVPLAILWFGLSIVVYAMNRHHPNSRVGHYTQRAAYRFYGLVGFVVVLGTFYGTNVAYWLVTWLIAALIIIPWSIWDLRKIRKEDWQDMSIEGESV